VGLVLALILIALVLGVIGLVARAVRWLLIIAAVLFVAGLVRGVMARGKTTT
jgi:hypothetical protein